MRLYPVFSLLLKDYFALKNNTDKDVSDQTFAFTVSLTAEDGNGDVSGTYPTVAVSDGESSEDTAEVSDSVPFTVTLKDGASWQIDNLPAGTQYSVTEDALPAGWTLISANGKRFFRSKMMASSSSLQSTASQITVMIASILFSFHQN